MANSLLDFVMSLVRDPDAAAHYAANPAQAIADAHLTDVTSVDVNNLIPVVSESLSMSLPTAGFDTMGSDPGGNVWASGAATAAFDSFADPVAAPAVIDTSSVVDEAVDAAGPADQDFASLTDTGLVDTAASVHFDAPVVEDTTIPDTVFGGDWAQPVDDDQPIDPSAGFDIFD